ncbi:MAG TPA: flagellar hook capping FlgD N-terminal domain-containing protein [Allosphingosinicella sp.]|jgi:flagellar basal-body rod modification protein FlgD|nr:flagellar hook capping FlgD N-terminal domain-containing protein [Allosphingosinicella sp.]
MTTIPSTTPATTGATSTLPGATMATGPAGAMTENDFLKLMTTQLSTQDPFNPVDNTQMVAQMAQFSQLAGISEMNQSLATMAQAFAPGRLSDAASWIGHSMLTQSDIATPLQNGAYAGQISLGGDADQVNLSFVDQTGKVVHSETLGAQKAGDLSFSWDGKDASGATVANGPVQIVVNASGGGKAVATTTATWTGIAGIQSPANGGTTKLVTGLGLLTPDAALQLS